jgi:hypothetical protein
MYVKRPVTEPSSPISDKERPHENDGTPISGRRTRPATQGGRSLIVREWMQVDVYGPCHARTRSGQQGDQKSLPLTRMSGWLLVMTGECAAPFRCMIEKKRMGPVTAQIETRPAFTNVRARSCCRRATEELGPSAKRRFELGESLGRGRGFASTEKLRRRGQGPHRCFGDAPRLKPTGNGGRPGTTPRSAPWDIPPRKKRSRCGSNR